MRNFFSNIGMAIARSAPVQRMAPTINRMYWGIRQNAPEILTWGGIGLMGVACITSARAAIGLEELKRKCREKEKEVEKLRKELAENEYKARMRTIKREKVTGAIKLFAGSAIEFGCGAMSVIYAHHLLRKEIIGLGAYVAALQEAQEKPKIEDAKGNETAQEGDAEATIVSAEANEMTFVFGPGTSTLWTGSKGTDEVTLAYAEQNANTTLESGKVIRKVFLVNDLFGLLEMEHTDAGSVAGWIKGGGDPIKLRILERLEDGSLVVAIKPHGIVNNLIGKVKI